jgi:hypothetical protein
MEQLIDLPELEAVETFTAGVLREAPGRRTRLRLGGLMKHPHVGLPVAADPIGDLQWCQATRKEIAAVTLQAHAGPILPIHDRCGELHGMRLGAKDASSEAHVEAHPRIKGKAVATVP